MNQEKLEGTYLERVNTAVEYLKEGKGVIVTDDEELENE